MKIKRQQVKKSNQSNAYVLSFHSTEVFLALLMGTIMQNSSTFGMLKCSHLLKALRKSFFLIDNTRALPFVTFNAKFKVYLEKILQT